MRGRDLRPLLRIEPEPRQPQRAEHRAEERAPLRERLDERHVEIGPEYGQRQPRRPCPRPDVDHASPRGMPRREDERVGEHQVDELVRRAGRGEVDARVPRHEEVEPNGERLHGLVRDGRAELGRRA